MSCRYLDPRLGCLYGGQCICSSFPAATRFTWPGGAAILSSLVGLGITSAYWPGVSGAATTPRWCIAALLSIALFCHMRVGKATISHAMGLAFVAWALASFMWSEHPNDTVGACWLLLILSVAFCVGDFIDMRPVYLGCAAGLLISDGVAVAQLLGWDGPFAANVPAGLFFNKNYFAEISALVAIALVSERLWWALPAAMPGLVLTNCRGALLALIVLAVPLWRRSPRACIGIGAVVATMLIAITIGPVKIASASDRLDIWKSAWALLDWTGTGFGTFRESAPHVDWIPYKTGHAYNEFLEAAYETGWVGAAILLAFCATLLRGPLTTERLVLAALLVEACFDFPFHLPATAALGALVAGRAAGDLPRLRDALVPCGMALRRSLQGGAAWLARLDRTRDVRRHHGAP